MADVSEDARIVNSKRMQFREIKSGFTPFQDKDILIAKITPCFENGKGALVRGLETEHGFGSTEFHVIRSRSRRGSTGVSLLSHGGTRFQASRHVEHGRKRWTERVQTDFVAAYEIMLPSLPEQRRIAEVLAACDRELDLLARKRDALQRQKRGLMQQLLTGRVRVKV